MIHLDEANKFKWNIMYEYIPEQSKYAEVLIQGKYYDFIPDKGELIILNNILYSVTNKIYDFDKSNIVINLNKLDTI